MLLSFLPSALLGLISVQLSLAAPTEQALKVERDVAWGAEPECSPRLIAVATGIHLNLVAQYTGELDQTEKLIALLSATPLNTTALTLGKGGLIAFVEGGIAIREFWEAIIPANNAAIPGLKTYEAAQLVELGLAESLTGVPSHDLPILETIKSDVLTGIQLNEANEENATKGCNVGIEFPPINV